MPLDPFTAGFDLIKTSLDKLFPDANEEMKARINQTANEISNDFNLKLAQVELNKIEAGKEDKFASNWRPAVGWTCCLAFFYSSILEPLMQFIAMVGFGYSGNFPKIETEVTYQLLLALLGMGAMRSYDKKVKTTK